MQLDFQHPLRIRRGSIDAGLYFLADSTAPEPCGDLGTAAVPAQLLSVWDQLPGIEGAVGPHRYLDEGRGRFGQRAGACLKVRCRLLVFTAVLQHVRELSVGPIGFINERNNEDMEDRDGDRQRYDQRICGKPANAG